MTKDEALKLALEALDLLAKYENPSTKIQVRKPRDGGPIVTMYPHKVATDAAALLRERLAQPEPEPVATVYDAYDTTGIDWHCKDAPATGTKLYTAPPQHEWQRLSDAEIHNMTILMGFNPEWVAEVEIVKSIVRNLEAKLKEKNT